MMELIEDKVGKKVLALGNEAIVRGAVEGGVAIAATYPGTPSSEIGNTLFKVAKPAGMYFEFSSNEKLAMEVAGSAAMSGVRSLAFMKHVGLNVAADAFMTLNYTGVRGGMIIVVADDPSMHSSQNEQDTRYYSRLSGAPMLEPFDPQECKDMMVWGIEMSEKVQLPFLFRTTTRVNHVRGPVEFGPIKERITKVEYERDPARFVVVPAHARVRHKALIEARKKALEVSENCPFNKVVEPMIKNDSGPMLGIITSGVSYAYVKELVDHIDMGTRVQVLKLGMTSPLPEKMILNFINSSDAILVVEELEPYLEDFVKGQMMDNGIFDKKVYGKGTGTFDILYEFNPDLVLDGLFSTVEDMGVSVDRPELKCGLEATDLEPVELPNRPPILCPGCPHRATFFALNKAVKHAIYSMDIGCYTLGIQPPADVADLLLCMGSSVGGACGLSRAQDVIPVGFAGDSTFFHTVIPGLVNAVHNKHRLIMNVLDNRTTAMTGHQPHPGLPVDGMGDPAPALDIERICKAVECDYVKTVDPLNIAETTEAFKEAEASEGVAVVVTKSPCALLEVRDKRRAGIPLNKYTVDQEACKHCGTCIRTFACPAFYTEEGEEKKNYFINPALCNGCEVCGQVCPFNAMVPINKGGDE